MRMADRLNIDREYQEGFVRKYMDAVDMLMIKSKGERIDGFMLAFALGVREGYRTPSRSSLGVINETAARGRDNALPFIYSVALRDLRKEGRDNLISDAREVFKIAEEYANTGFKVLTERMLPKNPDEYDEETFEMELIQMMDEKYAEITGEIT